MRRGFSLFFFILFGLSSSFAQTTFTANSTGNWTTIAWSKTGTASAAIYPGQPGYEAEVHDVVINGAGITVTLNTNIISSVRNITLTNGTLEITSNSLTMTGNLTGNAILTFTSGTVNIAGNNTSAGTFTASTGTMNYFGGNQTIRATTYYHLGTSGNLSTKTLGGIISILGNLSIGTGTVLDVSANNYAISIAGSWLNDGTFNERLGTVTFNGTSAQSIITSVTPSETFYNLTFNSAGPVTSNVDLPVRNILTMTNGTIIMPGKIMTLGINAASPGTLTYTSGWITGTFSRWATPIHNGVNLLFPVGTDSFGRSMTLDFMNIISGGLLSVNSIAAAPGAGGLPLFEGSYLLNQLFPEGYWHLTKNGSFTFSGTFNLRLVPSGFTTYPINAETRIVSRFNATDWFLNGIHVGGSSALLLRNNLNSFTNDYAVAYAETCTASLLNCPGDIVVNNDPGTCSNNVSWIPPAMSFPCPGYSITSNYNPGDLFNVGTQKVTYYLWSGAVKKDSCEFNVIVLDNEPPVVLCKDINLYIGPLGTTTLPGADISNGSSDNCSVSLIPDRSIFTCADVGLTVPVILTGTDPSGNSAICTAQVTVLDTLPPTINTRTFNLVLDATGNETLLPADVDNGSFDNCTPVTLSVFPNAFSCSDQGTRTVTLTATDNYGNSSSANVDITISSSLQISSMSLSNCELAAPYAIYLSNVSGGDGNYTYFWDGLNDSVDPFLYTDLIWPLIHFTNTSAAETPFFNNLMPDGTYIIRLTVTDGIGCTAAKDMIIVKSGTTFNNITVNKSNGCEGETISYTVNYDPAATYNWGVENGTILTAGLDTNKIDILWNTGVAQGVVIATITKINLIGELCESSVIDSVSIYPVPVPQFNSPQTDACSNVVTVYTLTQSYSSYSWTVTGGTITGGGTGGSNFVSVRWGAGPSGRVTVAVNSATGCSGSIYVDVNIFNLSGSVASLTNVTCNGAANGQVTVAANPATGYPPYEYSLDGGPYQSSGSFTNLAPGIHVVTIRDALLCTFDVNFTITQPSVLSATITKTDVLCFGGTTGSISAVGSGGTSPYQYSLDGGAFQASGTFSGLSAGLHFLIVSDNNLCIYNQNVNISGPAMVLSGSIVSQIDVRCFGEATGSVTVNGSGGTTPYLYRLNAGANQASGTFNGLTGGSYTVTVQDANLCTYDVLVIINQPAILTGTTIVTNITCFGANDGSINLSVSGGTPGYTYIWSNGATTEDITNIAPGTYNVIITDSQGCTANASGSVTEPPLISATALSNSPVCEGSALNITGGPNGMTSYSWTGPNGFTSLLQNPSVSASATLAMAGTYTLVVTDAGGCTASANTDVTIDPLNTITLTSAAGTNNQTVCISTAITNITYSTTGATGATFTGLPAGVTGSWAANVVAISGTPTATGSFNYTITLTGGCGTVTANGTITASAGNTITLTSAPGTDNQTVCIGNAITTIRYVTTGATGANFTGLPAGMTVSWAANNVVISGSPTTSGIYNYTINLTGGCGTISATGTITVMPVNTITLTSAAGTNNQTVCIISAITNITYSTTGATGATFTGLPSGVTGTWAANAVTISGTPTATGSFNYTVTLTGGCGTISVNGTIIVAPDNTITLTSPAGTISQTVCINTPITNITYATTGATGATFAGLPAGVTGSWAAGAVTISGTPTASGPFSYTATLTGGCGTVTANGTITVTPDNTMNLTSVAGTDNQTRCINTPIINITYSTTGATGATITGLPAGVTGSWAASVVTISGTPTASGPFNYIVTLTGGCGTISANGTITVTPNNTVTLTSAAGTNNQTVCINTAITNITYLTTGATGATFTGLPAGVTGNWAANVATISGTPTASGPFNYTVTLTGGCGTIVANGSITVSLANTITLTSAPGTDNQTVCIGNAITTIRYVTTGATGANFTGLPAGMTVSWAANNVVISGSPTTSGIYNYTINLTGGCGTVSATGTITVMPVNTITLTSAAGTNNQTVCISSAITNITYSTTGATGATFTGLPSGVTGTWAANAVTISGTPTATGSFSYTVTLTGGCGTISVNGTIIVAPNNTVTLTSPAGTISQTVCISTPITNITYATTGATGATFAGLPAGVTGSWAVGAVTISGTPTASGPFSYTVTLTGGCGTITANGTITVTTDNTMNLTSAAGTDNQTLCINTPIINITYSTTGATGATISGLPAGVTGSWAANVVTISGTPTASGSFSYTVTLTGGCGNVTANGTITVTPDNTVILTSAAGTDNQTVCINTPLTSITYGTTGATGAIITGLPAGVTGIWAANVVTISGTPAVLGPFSYTVTLTGGCGAITVNGSITVSPDNTLILTSAAGTENQTICINTPLTSITYGTTGATGALISGLPAGVTGTWAADVVTISGTPTVTGPFSYTVTLTGGCSTVISTGTITVSGLNTISLSSAAGTDNQSLCINTPVINITYSTTGATGATFAGLPTGVTGIWAADIVTISGAPTASGTFNYTVTLTGGCGANSVNGTLTVTPDNVITLTSAAGTDNQTICINTPVTDIRYSTTGATGVTFAGLPAGVTGTWAANVVTISGTPTASGPFNYTVTLTGGCGTITANGTITVTPENTIILTSAPGTDNQTVCIGDAITPITYITTGASGADFTGLPAGMTVAWAANLITISGSPTTTGIYNYRIDLKDGCGTISATGTITVMPANTITLTSAAGTDNQTVCLISPLINITYSTIGATGATITGLPAGITGSWAADVVTITGAPTVSGSFNYLITLTGGCGTTTANGIITVSPDNTITLTSAAGTDNQTVCINTPITNITYATAGATGASVTGLPAGVTGSWAADVVTISGTPAESGPFSYTITLTGGCGTITANSTMTITPDNTITLTSVVGTDNQTVCVNTPVISIIYGTTGATGATFAGLPAGVTGTWAADAVAISGTPTLSGSFAYTVTLTGGCGVVTIGGILIVNDVPSGSTVVTDVLCNGAATGAIDLSATGGTLPYSFLWSNGAVTEDPANLAAGTYTVTITDANLCTGIASGTITEPATPLSGAITTQTNVTVNGGNDGSVTVDGLGGVAPYMYKLDAGAYQASGTFSSLTAATYTVTVQDANFCTIDVPVTITQPSLPLSGTIVSYTDVLCFGDATGSVTVTGVDGLAPYEYSLDGGAYQSSGTYSTLVAGSYTVTVRDALPGTFDVPVTIAQPAAPLTVTTIQVDELCAGAGSGSATATGAGGTAPYSYSWNTTPVQTGAAATGLKAGTHTVTVTDANGCTANANVTITEPGAVTVITTQTNALCNGGATGTATAVPAGGTGPYAYSWNTSPVQTGFTATGLGTGSYIVTVTDANGCTGTGSVTITEPAPLALDATPFEAGCPDSNDGSITLEITGGTPLYTVIWNDGITTQNRTDVLPETYSVVVTDANGCQASTNTDVGFTGSFGCLVIPDIITPDPADGYNDEWIIRNIDIYPDAEVRIFTRWGKMIFKTKNISANPWNGRYSDGRLVPTDSYHYILYLNDGSGPRSGVISVIR